MCAVNFKVQSAIDHAGGQDQPATPTGPWTDLALSTTYTAPYHTHIQADTVTVWVKATDAMGAELVERVQVTFDDTQPTARDLKFHMNAPVEGIDFSST